MRENARQLSSDAWTRYFSCLAEGDAARLVAVEVVSGQEAVPPLATGRRLRAIEYDAQADVLEIAEGDILAGDTLVLRHFICAPRSITVQDDGYPTSSAILVEDASGVCTRIDVFAPALGARPRGRVRRGRCRGAGPCRRSARRAALYDGARASVGRG